VTCLTLFRGDWMKHMITVSRAVLTVGIMMTLLAGMAPALAQSPSGKFRFTLRALRPIVEA
jgi:hypothetical protein